MAQRCIEDRWLLRQCERLTSCVSCGRKWVTIAKLMQWNNHATGSAVVDLIFSIANREVTFFSGTEAISRL